MDDLTDTDLADERELVAAAVRDPEAFTVLYRHYLPKIHAFARRRTGSTVAAEDVTAAVFERAYSRLGSFRWRAGGFAPWIFRIAANELTDHYRRSGREGTDRGQVALANHRPAPMPQPEETAVRRDDGARVRAALAGLTDRQQEVIALRYLADVPPDVAARAMGMTKGALAVSLHRALKALRREVELLDPEAGREPGEAGQHG